MTQSDGLRTELFLKEQAIRERHVELQAAAEQVEREAKELARERSEMHVERRRLELEKQQVSALREILRVERARFEKELKLHTDRIAALKDEARALETRSLQVEAFKSPEIEDDQADLREAALVAAIARLQQREMEFAEESARERRRLELEAERLTRKRDELIQRENKATIRS